MIICYNFLATKITIATIDNLFAALFDKLTDTYFRFHK